MSNFTPKVQEEFDYDGDTIVCTMRRLSKRLFLDIMPYAPEPGQVLLTPDKVAGLVNTLSPHLKDYVEITKVTDPDGKVYSGIPDADGEIMSFEEVIEQAYFTPLIAQVCRRLMEVSIVGKAKPSHSDEQSPQSPRAVTG